MFTPSLIQSCLTSLVGFPQTYLKGYEKIDAVLVGSESGIMLGQSAHPLITLENITASAKDFLKTDVLDYVAGTTYAVNEVVNSAGIIYFSLQDTNTAHTPVSEPLWWQASTLVSFYLRRVLNGAANNLFNTLFTQKKIYESAKTLLADTALYDGVGNLSRRVTKSGRFVGFKITPKQSDTVITISSLGLQFDTLNPELPIYVYHDSQEEPIAILELDINKAVSFTWKTLTTALKFYYNDDTRGDGGNYYVGYYEDDLIGQAIWRETQFNVGCSSCNTINSTLYKRWSKYVSIQPVYIDADFLNEDKNLFDVEQIINIDSQNWGMNLRLSVQCDVSNLICRNKFVFTDAYKLQVVHDLLNDMAYSVRDNQLKQKTMQLAMLALKGDKQDYSKGIETDLSNAIKTIDFDLTDLNSICLPCGKGVRVSSMYR